MPNASPRGLYGRNVSAWKAPVNVWARVGGVWKPAVNVWASTGTGPFARVGSARVGTARVGSPWRIIWGNTVNGPAIVAAAYVPVGTKVTVSWTAPVPNTAETWTVRRFDGSVVLSGIPVSWLTIDDDSPQFGTGAYTVEGVSGGVVSAVSTSNTITIDLQPATAGAALSGANSATVSWSPNAAQGVPDQWRVWNVTLGAWATGLVSGAATTATAASLTPGSTATFAVYPILNSAAGIALQGSPLTTPVVSVPAADLGTVNLAAVPSFGYGLRLSWRPSPGGTTGYEVQVYGPSTGNVWTPVDAAGVYPIYESETDTWFWDWVPTGTQPEHYMRVRALSVGGPSAWTQRGPFLPG